jgi:Domain of unknown function (DUF4126)
LNCFALEANMLSGLPWGLALSSGVNTYLPLFMLGLLARYTHAVHLSSRFQFLASDQALVILGALAACEILAQKFPGLDNVWDFVHTLLRPLAGAVAAGATLTTSNTFEMVAVMLAGATLATASHSAKSTLRLASTAKTFGAANILLSFAEDGAVVSGTLLAVYAPWLMLAVVLLFVLMFALFGPPLARMLIFDLRIVTDWIGWLGKRLFRAHRPENLRESLMDIAPERLKMLSEQLQPEEQLEAALAGWKPSKRGPRPAWLLVTDRRLVLAERRRLRKPKVQSLPFSSLSVVRYRGLGVFSRIELLTRENESCAFSLRKTQGPFATMAVERIRRRSGIAPALEGDSAHLKPHLAASAR